MRNILVILLTCLFAVILTACKEEQVVNKTENIQEQQSSQTEEQTEEQIDSNQEQKVEETVTANQQEEQQGTNLYGYRPEVGSIKTFTENGMVVFTEEIIAANDEYVQTLLQLGDNKTTQIYRWTENEITLVFEEHNMENPQEDILNQFSPIDQFETIVNNDASKMISWKLLATEGKESVSAGEFNQVLAIQKTTDEVVDEETTYTRYYAPKMGLIKEEFHLSGENGYSAKSELEKIE
nr:hypothetical protein [Neobacillus sp. Marseille-Q6967]